MPPTVAGAIHVHTLRSDGTGTVDAVAAAAARAGLQFVVLTDHGDGTRPPEPPAYRHGVLCLDGVEISTDEGHYLAVGLPAAPYRLGGEARAVIEDVARLGGFGIVAHPVSAKDELRWREWSAPFDAIEWLNADSEWRDESWWRLVAALARYPFRPTGAILSLFDRPELNLARWDAVTRRRPVVALAGVDAHARLSVPLAAEPRLEPVLLKLPSYEQAFRTFSTRLQLDAPLTGDAREDARAVMAALKAGRVFTAIDALATPPAFDFFARISGTGGRVPMGGTVPPDPLGREQSVDLVVRSVLPPGGEIVLFRDGRATARGTSTELQYPAPLERAVYRVEVQLRTAPGSPPVPWIVSNPIYLGRPPTAGAPPPREPARVAEPLYGDAATAAAWSVEHDPTSQAALAVVPNATGQTGPALALRFLLGKGTDGSPFVALVRRDLSGLVGYDRLSFRGRASRPVRLSVQVRLGGTAPGERWRRSVYLGPDPRDSTVFFDDLAPVGATSRRRPALADARAVMFVLDTTHTLPGTSGTLWFDEIRLEGPDPGNLIRSGR